MKKGKIILSSVVVLAVVGSALAFKTVGNTRTLYYCDDDNFCKLSDYNQQFGSDVTPDRSYFTTGTVDELCTTSNCQGTPIAIKNDD